jgi:hypothetical protein
MGFGSFFSGVASVVKSAVKSVAGSVASSVAKKGGIKGLFSMGLKQFAVSFIATAVFSFAYKKLAGKPKEPSVGGFDSEVVNRSTLVKSPISARQIVYGTVKKSGSLLYASTTGDDNKFLHLVIALASHEIQSIDKVFFNDVAIDLSSDIDGSGNVNTGTYNGKARIKTKFGTADQTADSDLVSENSNITSNHRFRGIAYLYIRLEYDVDVYPNGIPNISALIQGKKVLDYRTSTTAYSSNPALIVYDYLTSSDGMNASTSEIDTTSFTTSANDCEDSITLSDASTQNRYDCHGVVTLDRKPIEIIEDILSSCIGTLTYEQGKFVLKVGKGRSSVKTITEDDLAGEISVRAKPKRQDLYNQVKGVFADEDNNYVATDFPVQEDTTYQTADGETISREIQLNYTTNIAMAERIALVLLKQSRQMMTVNMIAKPTLLNLSVGDIVSLTMDKLGFSSKNFIVTTHTLNENLTVNLTLQEYSSTVYDYNSATDQTNITAPANLNLPSAFSVQAPTSLVLDDELRISNEGIVTSVITVSATDSSDAFVGRYECQFKKSTDSVYTSVGTNTSPVFDIHGVIDGTLYDIRIRAISSIGVKSAFLSGQHTVVGELDPPSDVEDFAVNIVGQDAHLSWSAVSDLDLAYYSINYSTLTSGAEWQNSVPLVQKVSRPATSITVPARVGSYLIKAVDKSGNFSSNEAVISTNITAIGNFNAVATQSEHPDFAGAKTNVVKTEDGLVLDTTELFDDNTTDNFDDIVLKNFDGGTQSGNLYTLGNYVFSDVIDIGGVFTSRVTASITQSATDRDRLFDNISGDFDAQPSNFDGDASVQSDTHLEIALSDDNVTYTPFRNFSVGDFSARYYKFRIVLTSRNGSATPVISQLSVTIDMPDRVISFNDQVSGTGTFTVTFTDPFKSSNYAIGVSAQGLATGDFYEITNKQTGSFDIAFKNSSNTGVSRTFDAICKGF